MFNLFRRRTEDAPRVEPQQKSSLFSGSGEYLPPLKTSLQDVWTKYLRSHAPRPVTVAGVAMDDDDSQGWNCIKSAYTLGQPNMSEALFQWFGTQSFIGHQACSIISQQWLIKKICLVPARDAIRQGFEIINEVGEKKLDEDVIAAYAQYDKKFKLMKHLLDYVFTGRRFGIRIAIPLITSPDPDFFEKPFNPDSIRPGSFKGWVQVDPYWTAPELDAESAGQPDSEHFYEPTWWQINGRRYHRSHLCIFRTEPPTDLLKPSYLYGGIPVPQVVMERVYAAERTANEAPLLAMTKRLYTLKIGDIESMMLNKEKFDESMAFMHNAQDNYGTRIMGSDDEMGQLDTSLAELSEVITTNYAIACAAGDAPVNKIMGTAAGGLSNEGSYDESSYHETLESLQTHELSPFVERHHLLVKLSYIIPKFGVKGEANTTVSWQPLDSPTAKEYAEINELNARADLTLIQTGAIDEVAVNERLRNDKNSGYSTVRPILEGEREPVTGQENEADPDLGRPGKVSVSETKQDGT